MRRTLAFIAGVALVVAADFSAAQSRTVPDPFQVRRDSAIGRLGHGLLIVTSAARPGESGVQQAASFRYFTGLESVLGGVLVLDGPAREARPGVAGRVAAVEPGRLDTLGVGRSGLRQVTEWSTFVPYLEQRLAADTTLILYLDIFDGAQPTVGTPLDTIPDGVPRRWREMLTRRWPSVRIRDGAAISRSLRMVKDDEEIRALRRVGQLSAAAFLAGLQTIRPGERQPWKARWSARARARAARDRPSGRGR